VCWLTAVREHLLIVLLLAAALATANVPAASARPKMCEFVESHLFTVE